MQFAIENFSIVCVDQDRRRIVERNTHKKNCQNKTAHVDGQRIRESSGILRWVMKSLNSNQNYAAILRFFGWPWVRKTIKQIAKLNVNNTGAAREAERERDIEVKGERGRDSSRERGRAGNSIGVTCVSWNPMGTCHLPFALCPLASLRLVLAIDTL